MADTTDLERLIVRLEADLTRYARATEAEVKASDRRFRAIEQRADRMSSGITRSFQRAGLAIGAALGGFSATALARETLQAADSWTRYANQLAAAGVAQGDLNAVMDDAVEIARRTRSSLEGTIGLYSRLQRSTQQLGLSQRELARITEIVNMGFVAGGAAPSERAAATLQLSQALASGFLQGDELRSLRENAPALLQAIARELGVTIGELKRLGAEGKLTTETLVGALLDGGSAIEDQFSRTRVTVADAMEAIRTELVAAVGRINLELGASGGLANALSAVADQISNVGREGSETDRLVAAVQMALADPESLDQLEALSKEVQSLVRERQALQDRIVNLLRPLLRQRGDISVGMEPGSIGAELVALAAMQRRLQAELANPREGLSFVEPVSLRAARAELEALRAAGAGAADEIAKLREELAEIEAGGPAAVRAGDDPRLKEAALLREELERLVRLQNAFLSGPRDLRLPEEYEEVQKKIAETQQALRDLFATGQEQGPSAARLAAETAFAEERRQIRAEQLRLRIAALERPAQEALERERQQAQEMIEDLRGQIARVGDAEAELVHSFLERLPEGATDAQRAQVEELARALFAAREALDAQAEGLDAVAESAEEAASATELLYERLQALFDRDDAMAGLERGLIRAQLQAGTLADAVEEGVAGAFYDAEGAIREFVETGEVDFKRLIASILADLAVLAARQAVLGPIAQGLSGFFGGTTSASVQHAGGMAGAGPGRRVPALAFAGAPRLHAGGGFGLRADEHPAILQTGERVLSRQETRALHAGARVTVNIMTPSPEAFRASRVQIASDLSRALMLGQRGM